MKSLKVINDYSCSKNKFNLFITFFFLNSFILGWSQDGNALSSSYSPGAISGALAGAGNSSVDIGESYIINPATVAHLRGAAITMGNSSYQDSDKDAKKIQSGGWHFSLNEFGEDSIFATSIYVSKGDSRDRSSLYTNQSFNDVWLTIGNFVMPNLSAGLSYRIHDTLTTFKKYQEQGIGVGFLWNPVDSLGVGFSMQNLVPIGKREIPNELTLGTHNGIGILYIYDQYLRIRMDYSKIIHKLDSQSSTEWAFGLENAINSWILTRIGISQSLSETQEKTQKWTFGMGFSGPRFGIHYAFQQYKLSQNGQEHGVDLVIPF